MSQNGFGTALRWLRDRRALSGREFSLLADVDYAYEYRLEIGEKTNPSEKIVDKMIRVLKPSDRDARILRWLAEHPITNSKLVEHVLQNPSVSLDVFSAAAATAHRGVVPEPADLIERVRKILEE